MYFSAGSGEEDGEESYDDLQSKRTLEDCEGGTAAGRDNSDDSDDDDNDRPTQEAAAERPEHLQNGQVAMDLSTIDGSINQINFICTYTEKRH